VKSYVFVRFSKRRSIAISSSEAMSNEGISLYDKSVINYDADGKILSASHGEIKSTEYSATH
jgi:hypothetical protein